jgi:hypothetical protein
VTSYVLGSLLWSKTVFSFWLIIIFEFSLPPNLGTLRMPRFGDLCENSNSETEHTVGTGSIHFGEKKFWIRKICTVRESESVDPYPDGPLSESYSSFSNYQQKVIF